MTHVPTGSLILAFVLMLCGLGQGRALAAEAECQSDTTQVKALSSGPQHTEVNFNTDINAVPDATGYFDPAPLLSTTIDVNGGRNRTSCLIAHLSVEVAPLDNHVMFQVLVDGVPMHGHGIFPYSVPTVLAPVVWDPRRPTRTSTGWLPSTFSCPSSAERTSSKCAGRDAADLRTAIPSPSRPSRMQCSSLSINEDAG